MRWISALKIATVSSFPAIIDTRHGKTDLLGGDHLGRHESIETVCIAIFLPGQDRCLIWGREWVNTFFLGLSKNAY